MSLEKHEKLSVKLSVTELSKTAGQENWDGEDALAVAPPTVETAKKLVDLFPKSVPPPDVSPTPHGEIDFDWILSQEIMLTVSVGHSGKIAFAGIFTDLELHGERSLTEENLPAPIRFCFDMLRESSASETLES